MFYGVARVEVTLGPSTHRLSDNGEGGATKPREVFHVGAAVCREDSAAALETEDRAVGCLCYLPAAASRFCICCARLPK